MKWTKEYEKEYMKRYREKNGRNRKWEKEHPERSRKRTKEWKKNNPEKHALQGKRYRENHREQVQYWHRRYKARKQNAEGSHTFGEWELLKKQYGFTCPCCGRKEPKIRLSEDHIIPLKKGGSDYIENIQPLCVSCNVKKNVKVIYYNFFAKDNKKEE